MYVVCLADGTYEMLGLIFCGKKKEKKKKKKKECHLLQILLDALRVKFCWADDTLCKWAFRFGCLYVSACIYIKTYMFLFAYVQCICNSHGKNNYLTAQISSTRMYKRFFYYINSEPG